MTSTPTQGDAMHFQVGQFVRRGQMQSGCVYQWQGQLFKVIGQQREGDFTTVQKIAVVSGHDVIPCQQIVTSQESSWQYSTVCDFLPV